MNPDSMSEADLTKSFTHDRPEPTTQPPSQRPATIVLNDCQVCGLPVAAPQQFHPTKQDCIRALRARVEALDREIHAAGLRATTGASRKPLEMRCSHCQQTTPIRLEGLFQALAKDRA
jgi:hypothetical protein